jgi:hypothetical protein
MFILNTLDENPAHGTAAGIDAAPGEPSETGPAQKSADSGMTSSST